MIKRTPTKTFQLWSITIHICRDPLDDFQGEAHQLIPMCLMLQGSMTFSELEVPATPAGMKGFSAKTTSVSLTRREAGVRVGPPPGWVKDKEGDRDILQGRRRTFLLSSFFFFFFLFFFFLFLFSFFFSFFLSLILFGQPRKKRSGRRT